MSRRSRRLGMLIVVALLGGCHSEPFGPENYGAVGAFVDAPAGRIASTTSVPEWLADGRALYYAGSCLSRPHVPRTLTPVAGIDLMAAGGGSVLWERCDDHISQAYSLDSAATFAAAAVNSDGAVAYVEVDKQAFHGATDPDPVLERSELWLSDTVESLSIRRHLMTLYRDNNGVATVGPDVINWFTTMRWTDPTTLLAIAINARPNGADSTLGVARISIGADAATAAIVPGAERATSYSLAAGGSMLIIARDLLHLYSIPAAGGAAAALVSVPPTDGRHIVDVSCVGALCLVLTAEPGQSIFWRLDLTANTLAQLRRDDAVYRYARWSPQGKSVLVGKSDGVYLFPDVMP